MDQNNFIKPFDLKNILEEEGSANILSAILNEAPDIIYLADIETRQIVYINARVKEILGLTEEDIYNKGFDFFPDIVHPDDYLKRMEQMSRIANQNNDQVVEIEARLEVKNGNYHWFRIRERIFSRKENGEVEKIVGITTDIQKEKLAEEDVKKLNRQVFKKNQELKSLNSELESISRLTAGEFRETFQIMYTCLEYIATKDADKFSNTGKANLRRAQSYVQKLRLTTHDVSAYLQLNKLNAKANYVDLNRVVNNAMNGLTNNDVRVSLQIARLPSINGDPLLLSLLFKNLLENAIKFRKEDQAAIKIHYLKADEINFHPLALRDTVYHIISVADNGIGFEKEHAEKIFRIFYRIHDHQYRGAGMGLAVSKKIMEQHGGFIEAESNPGEGARFTCYFPEEESSGGGEKFLVKELFN
jgi:PAS domain S-box-containing protein